MSDRYSISIGRIRHPTDFSHGSEVACTHAFRLNKREQLTSILAVNPVNPRVRELSRRWIQKIGVPISFDVNAVTPVRADPEFRSRRAIDLLTQNFPEQWQNGNQLSIEGFMQCADEPLQKDLLP